MRRNILLYLYLLFPGSLLAQQNTITGLVMDENGPVGWVSVGLRYTSSGTITDEHGKFTLGNVPNGDFEIIFSHVGYQQELKKIFLNENKEVNLHVYLKPTLRQLDEMVVTGTRTEKQKALSVVAVQTLDSRTLENTQSQNLSEGLNFQPGLRVEVNCQTCNYTQLRINGLGGAYSQLLINNRPVFNSLMGLYGLEQLSTDMIEKVEVVKGGGSALYGTNAIGGTVNIITNEPKSNQVTVGINGGLINHDTPDLNYYANVSKKIKRGGITLFSSGRNRSEYDHNGDGFSEIPKVRTLSLGFKTNLKIHKNQKINFDFLNIREYRRGGNKINESAHLSDQAEEREHNIFVGGFDYTLTLPGINSNVNTYFAGQYTYRKHYTGIDGADAYGTTYNHSINTGIQWNYYMPSATLTFGIDHLTDDVYDRIPGYNYVTDQITSQTGLFSQADISILDNLNLLAGIRIDQHNFINKLMTNPRISLMYSPIANLQFRGSYGTGFRAPQAFDADLHVAFAGGGVSYIRLDDNLKEERSQSWSASINYDNPTENYIYGITLEGFHTLLNDPFIIEQGEDDDQGNYIMEKKNGSNSRVYGLTLEVRLNYKYFIEFDMGLTIQRSFYDEAVYWSSEIAGEEDYLRTPDKYGFFTFQVNPTNHLHINLSGIVTGPMKVPHFGGAPGIDGDRLKVSSSFWNNTLKISQDIFLNNGKQELEVSAGIQNIFNAYQNDFDSGRYRDSNYVYGPPKPRTIFIGIKFNSIY